jgi:hypothetical protein
MLNFPYIVIMTVITFYRKARFWAPVATIISCLVGIITLLFKFSELKHAVFATRDNVRRIEKLVIEDRFNIIYPSTGTVVDQQIFVRGYLPFKKKRVYLIVTPDNGQSVVQETGVTLFDHEWQGMAQLGTSAAGAGRMFSLKAIATDVELDRAALTHLPSDAVVSTEVIVRRKSE